MNYTWIVFKFLGDAFSVELTAEFYLEVGDVPFMFLYRHPQIQKPNNFALAVICFTITDEDRLCMKIEDICHYDTRCTVYVVGAAFFNPSSATFKLNFYPLEVVSRYRDPQLQVGKKYLYLPNLTRYKCKYANLTLIYH